MWFRLTIPYHKHKEPTLQPLVVSWAQSKEDTDQRRETEK